MSDTVLVEHPFTNDGKQSGTCTSCGGPITAHRWVVVPTANEPSEMPVGRGHAPTITLFGIPVHLRAGVCDDTNGAIVMSPATWFKIEALLSAEITAIKQHTAKFLQLLVEKH